MSVLGLPEARAHLNLPATFTGDSELQSFIDAAEASIAQRVGPLSPSTLTKRVPGYAWNLHLPTYPAVSLTSVTPVGGSALTLSDLYLEKETGAVSYNGSGFFSSAAYDVVYVAGRSPVPEDLLQAVKKRLKADWTDQRGGGRGPGTQQPEVFVDEERAIARLIAPYELLPGLA